jgi:hypothetical protein
MTDPIASLTDEQAINAIRLFYDYTTPDLWEDEEKPSIERVKTIAAALVENAPADVQPVVAVLVDDHQPEQTAARAEVCRLILSQLRQSPVFGLYADRAIDTAKQPHMAIDPITGVFIIAVLLATTKVESTPNGWNIEFGGGSVVAIKALPKLLHELPPIIKALPESVLKANHPD